MEEVLCGFHTSCPAEVLAFGPRLPGGSGSLGRGWELAELFPRRLRVQRSLRLNLRGDVLAEAQLDPRNLTGAAVMLTWWVSLMTITPREGSSGFLTVVS